MHKPFYKSLAPTLALGAFLCVPLAQAQDVPPVAFAACSPLPMTASPPVTSTPTIGLFFPCPTPALTTARQTMAEVRPEEEGVLAPVPALPAVVAVSCWREATLEDLQRAARGEAIAVIPPTAEVGQ